MKKTLVYRNVKPYVADLIWFCKGEFRREVQFHVGGKIERSKVEPSRIANLVREEPANIVCEQLFNCQSYPEALCAVCETFDVTI